MTVRNPYPLIATAPGCLFINVSFTPKENSRRKPLTVWALVRGDLLIVRELARIQGFNDDFLFYGSPEAQEQGVLTAEPPVVSKAIHFST